MADINIQELNDSLIEIKTLLKSTKELDKLTAKNIELQIEILSEKIRVVNKRIADLEANQKWTVTAIIGGVITAIGGLIYTQK